MTEDEFRRGRPEPLVTPAEEVVTVERLAAVVNAIVRAVDSATANPHLAASALWQAVSGYYGRLAADANTPEPLLRKAIEMSAQDAATKAVGICRMIQEARADRGGRGPEAA